MRPFLFAITLASFSISSAYSQWSFKANASYLKIFELPASPIGVEFSFLKPLRNNDKNAIYLTLGAYKKAIFEYEAIPTNIFNGYQGSPVTSNAEISYTSVTFGYNRFFIGGHDEEKNVYGKFDFSVLSSKYYFEYEEYDDVNYEFKGRDAEDLTLNGWTDIYIGAGLGVEKRINLVGIFIELSYQRGLLGPFQIYKDSYLQPFGNHNLIKFGAGVRFIK
jgi:hypothetical protein